MGKYEPYRPPRRPAPVRRISGNKIVSGLASILTTVVAGGYFAMTPTMADLSAYERRAAPAVVETTGTRAASTIDVIGTTPVADGNYIQVLPRAPMAADTLAAKLSSHGLRAYEDPVDERTDRILVQYEPRDLHDLVKEIKRIDPTFGARLISRDGGVDHFRAYHPRPRFMNSLDDYITAANGHLELMPFHEIVDKEAKEMAQTLPYTEKQCEKMIYSFKWQESEFKPHAKSHAGARGLMQVMPSTARWLGFSNVKRLYEPEYNIQAGTKALTYSVKFALERKGKDAQIMEILPLTGAHYNAGEGNVVKGRHLLFRETRRYMQAIPQHYQKLDAAFPG